jgi:hypothetical protein
MFKNKHMEHVKETQQHQKARDTNDKSSGHR